MKMNYSLLKKGSIVRLKLSGTKKEEMFLVVAVSRKEKEFHAMPLPFSEIYEEIPLKLNFKFSEVDSLMSPKKFDLLYLLAKKNKVVNTAVKKVLLKQ